MTRPTIKAAAVCLAMLVASVLLLCSCAPSTPPDEEEQLPKLRIGVDYYEPFAQIDEKGDFDGIDIDIATEVCKHIGYEPVFVHINWTEKDLLLANGTIDCIWSCFTYNGREDKYAWTLPYMNSRQVVAVPVDSDIKKIADLADRRVAVQATCKPDEIFSGRANVKDLEVPAVKELDCFSDIKYTFAALNSGYVDAIAGHEPVLQAYMKTSYKQLRILDEPLLNVQVAVAFLYGTHDDVIQRINHTLYLLRNNGYMADLCERYGLDEDKYVINYEQEKR